MRAAHAVRTVFQHSLKLVHQVSFVKYFSLQSVAPESTGVTLSEMGDLGKILIFVGFGLVALGLALVLAGKANLPIGRLPGDILYRGKNTTFYFPLATSIVISVVLSAVLYLIGRMRH